LIATMMTKVIAAAEPFEGCSKPGDDWNWSWTVPGCDDPASPVGDLIKNSAIQPFVDDAQQGVADATKTMMTFWTSVPDPTINDGGATAGVITFLHSNLAWLSALILVFCTGFAAIQMMFTMNGAPLRAIMRAVMLYLLTSALLVTAVAALMAITSALASLILDQSTEGGNFADNLFSLFDTTAGVASGILLIVMFIIAMILSGLMTGVMIGRGGMLLVLCGTSLVTASATGTETGMQAFKTQLGWIGAWISIKLSAAVVYGAGFKLLSTDTSAADNSLLQIMYGLTLIFLSILALPATMRLVHPIVAPVAGGNGLGGTIAGAGMVVASAGLRR
jgi:hypothetical protein